LPEPEKASGLCRWTIEPHDSSILYICIRAHHGL
jgi:hypothetical protein